MGESSISMGHFPPFSMAMLNNQRVETNNSTSVKRRPSRCNQNLHGFRGFTMIFASIETKQQHQGDIYPLVMTNITMERSTIFHGTIHYFYGDFP